MERIREGSDAKRNTSSSEQQELRSKGRDQRWLSERYGRRDDGTSNHPLTKRTGRKGASNVGEDESSGSE